VIATVLSALLRPVMVANGDFYNIVPHRTMETFFGVVALIVAIALAAGAMQFWRDTGMQGSVRSVRRAIRDVLQLEYLRSGGAGCTYPTEHHSQSRRWFHHLTFYGFLLCFASTTVAAVYHYGFGWLAPYGYLSLPVILGTLGGAGLVVGLLGLSWLKFKQDPATANSGQNGLDAEFIVLLLFTSVTGLLLLALRETRYLSGLLFVHLGSVAALFLTMPYGKFVHGLYRSLALLRYAREQD
jgi:citrate/tricarballylate utilization protein